MTETAALSPGEEHVLRAMDVCRGIAGDLAALDAVEAAWRSEAAARLERLEATLDQIKGRFILKSKVCLPFAARCEEHVRALEESVGALRGSPEPGDTAAFDGRLDALEKAVRALDGRSDMRGMAIT